MAQLSLFQKKNYNNLLLQSSNFYYLMSLCIVCLLTIDSFLFHHQRSHCHFGCEHPDSDHHLFWMLRSCKT